MKREHEAFHWLDGYGAGVEVAERVMRGPIGLACIVGLGIGFLVGYGAAFWFGT